MLLSQKDYILSNISSSFSNWIKSSSSSDELWKYAIVTKLYYNKSTLNHSLHRQPVIVTP
jgi:hypothetical protein